MSFEKRIDNIEKIHENQIEELLKLEIVLIEMVVDIENEELLNALLDWQNQRLKCNKTTNKWLRLLNQRIKSNKQLIN